MDRDSIKVGDRLVVTEDHECRTTSLEQGEVVTARQYADTGNAVPLHFTGEFVCIEARDEDQFYAYADARYLRPENESAHDATRLTTAPHDPVTTAVNLLGGPSPDLDVAKVAVLVALIRGEELAAVVKRAAQPAVEGTWDPTDRSTRANGRRVRARDCVTDNDHDYSIEEQHFGRTGTVAQDDRSRDDSLFIEWDRGSFWHTNPADLIGIG